MRKLRPGIALLLALLLFVPPSTVGAQSDSLLHQGAKVRIESAQLGSGWFNGQVAAALMRGTRCLGVAVFLPQDPSHPVVVLYQGIQRIEVDRRTNTGVAVAGLPDATEADWETLDLARLRSQDPCGRDPRNTGTPGRSSQRPN